MTLLGGGHCHAKSLFHILPIHLSIIAVRVALVVHRNSGDLPQHQQTAMTDINKHTVKIFS